MSPDAEQVRDALRAASDGILLAIREVEARERAKRAMLPGDPGFAEVAREVRIAAEAVLVLARQEEAKADETAGSPTGAALPTISESRPPHELADILEEWRAVERKLATADPVTPEGRALMEQFEQLRDRYADSLRHLRDKA